MTIAGVERNSNQPPESSSLYSLLKYFDQEEARNIVGEFLISPQAINILTTIENFKPLNRAHRKQFEATVAGTIFEGMAYLLLSPLAKAAKEELLAPHETFTLYQEVHPDKQVINHYGLTKGLHGISIPDGLILYKDQTTRQITGLCEYTLTNTKRQSSRFKELQLQSFLDSNHLMENLQINSLQGQKYLGQMLHLMRPDLLSLPVCCSSTLRIVYVVPEDSFLVWPDQERVKQVFLPLTKKEFGGFVRELLKHPRGRQRIQR